MDTHGLFLWGGFESIAFCIFYEILFNRKNLFKNDKLKYILFCSLFVAANYWSTNYMPKAYHTLFVAILSILLFSLVVNKQLVNSAIAYLFYVAMISVTEFSVAAAEMLILNISTKELISNSLYLLTHNIISAALQLIVFYVIYKLNINITKINLFKKENAILYNIIIETGLFSIFIFISNIGIINIKNVMAYNVIVFLIYFIFLLIQIKDLKERENLLNIYNSYKVQEKQIQNMEEIISIIRQEKHDFANHINIIQGLCLLNKPNTVERIRDYVSKISDSIHSSFRYLNTGNDYIDGLLSIKYNYALKNSINFQVIIESPLDDLNIKADELISIVSNLIDNAFESFRGKESSENKNIIFNTYLEYNKFCIKIIDNGEPIPEAIKNKIFERGFSTKVKLKQDHGYGLFITKDLVENNNGEIHFKSIEGETYFLIKFPMLSNK